MAAAPSPVKKKCKLRFKTKASFPNSSLSPMFNILFPKKLSFEEVSKLGSGDFMTAAGAGHHHLPRRRRQHRRPRPHRAAGRSHGEAQRQPELAT